MKKAKQCDRCGMFYSDRKRGRIGYFIQVAVIRDKSIDISKIDLCEECLADFWDFCEEKKHDK